MKKIINLILTGFFVLLTLNSCSSDESSDLDDEQDVENTEGSEAGNEEETGETETGSCIAPIDLAIEVEENAFSSDEAILTWTAGDDETEWLISYTDFFGENEYVVTENTLTIETFLEDSIITIKSICGEDSESEIATFPEIESIEVVENMTATVNGVSYSNLKNRASFVFASEPVTPGLINSEDLWLQGASNYTSGIEINLFIDESDWKVGVYELKGGQSQDLTDEDTHAEFYRLNDDNLYYVEDSGSIEITKFDSEERLIEGTFSFSYNVYDSSTYDLISTENVENGTFVYTLDEVYFE